jgi:hypothetical protein
MDLSSFNLFSLTFHTSFWFNAPITTSFTTASVIFEKSPFLKLLNLLSIPSDITASN